MSRTLIIPEMIYNMEIFTRAKYKNSEKVVQLSDLQYSIRINHNYVVPVDNFETAEALLQVYRGVSCILLFGKGQMYDCDFLNQLLCSSFSVSEINLEDGNGDEIFEPQNAWDIPRRWNYLDFKVILGQFNYFGRYMSELYRTTLEEHVRDKMKFGIIEKRIEIEYSEEYYREFMVPEGVIKNDRIHKYYYNLITNKSSNPAKHFCSYNSHTLYEYGMQFFLNAIKLNVDEITFDFKGIKIKTKSNLDHLKSDFLKVMRGIRNRNKSVKIFVTPAYIFELEKTFNFASILNEINWCHYLTREETTDLFGAHDTILGEFLEDNGGTVMHIPKPRTLSNRFKSMIIRCFDVRIINTTDDVSLSYKHDVSLSKTEFKDVNFDSLVALINAVPNIGQITFDYSNVNWEQSKMHLIKLRAHVYNLLSAIKRELDNILLEPHDFYQIWKRNNFATILNDVQLENFVLMRDMAYLALTYEHMIDSDGFEWTFKLWKCKYRKPLREIRVYFVNICVNVRPQPMIEIVGNDDFFYKFPNSNTIDVLIQMFQYFGPEVHIIRLSIQNWLFYHDTIDKKRKWFTKMRDVVIDNCANLNLLEVTYSGVFGILEDENWNGIPIHFKPLEINHNAKWHFEDEDEIIRDLNIRRYILTIIRLQAQQRNTMTERIFEMILKLPKLQILNFCVPFQQIRNFKFLENIKRRDQKTILPALQHLFITNCNNEEPYIVEELFASLSKASQFHLQITNLTLSNCHIRLQELGILQMKLQAVTFINCTIEENDTLRAESSINELQFSDMEVPLWIFKILSDIEFLTLISCSNINNIGLELILSRISKLSILRIANCPITDEIFYNYYISSQIGRFDLHADHFKKSVQFYLDRLSQCSRQTIEIFSKFYVDFGYDNIFPRVVKTDDFVQIIPHPFYEKLMFPDTSTFSTTFEQFFNASISLDTTIIRIDVEFLVIIGENNFTIPLGVQSPDDHDKLRSVFQCFGNRMQNIQILVELFLQREYHIFDTNPALYNLKYLINTIIEPNCINVQKITCGSSCGFIIAHEKQLLEECQLLKRINFKVLDQNHFKILNTNDEPSLILELQEKMHAICELNFPQNSEGITKQTMEIILKLPWLRRLTLFSTYKNISNWNFLENIKCTEHEQIMPRVQHLCLMAGDSGTITADQTFISNCWKTEIEIAQLDIVGFSLAENSFKSCCFVPEIIKFYRCHIQTDVNVTEFKCAKNIKALEFINMNLPLTFLTATTTTTSEAYNKFYLALTECPNTNDDELESLMKRSSIIQSVTISGCPISNDFFQKRSDLQGTIL